MPIYDHKCRSCGNQFETLVLPWKKIALECPSCHSQEVDQLFSAFAVNSKEKSEANWNAARKHFEKTELRDRKVAEIEAMKHHHH
ncbi:MAG: hypothetical protein HY313_09040 [Acidobacteria bacterium]|nr:hypothetical protein [Acidobacteriota bacterium]